MRRRLCLLSLLCGFAVACSKPEFNTEIAVVVWGDLAIPAEMDNIRVDVKGPSETRSFAFPLTTSSEPGKNTLPIRLSLVPPDNKNLAFEVTATGLLGNAVVVFQSKSLSFLPGQRKVLTLNLGRACAGIPCTPGSTCAGGLCIPTLISATSLPDYDPSKLPPAPDGGASVGGDSGLPDLGVTVEAGPVDHGSSMPVDSAVDRGEGVETFRSDLGLDSHADPDLAGAAMDSEGIRDAVAIQDAAGTSPDVAIDVALDVNATIPDTPASNAVDAPGPDLAPDLPTPDACQAGVGTSCGKCGGTVNCDGTCSIPTPSNLNNACGSCGGNITCDGTCSIPNPSNLGKACGACGGKYLCDGSCSISEPANYNQSCGNCGGKITCAGTCSVVDPSNYNQPCDYDCGCGCLVQGTIACNGTCGIPSLKVCSGGTCFCPL